MNGKDLNCEIHSMCQEYAWEKRDEDQNEVLTDIFAALMVTTTILLQKLPPQCRKASVEVIIRGLTCIRDGMPL